MKWHPVLLVKLYQVCTKFEVVVGSWSLDETNSSWTSKSLTIIRSTNVPVMSSLRNSLNLSNIATKNELNQNASKKRNMKIN